MIYILTQSDQHYPTTGTGDWRGIYRTLGEATERADSMKRSEAQCYVIEVDVDNLQSSVVWYED